jgi:hypothetical protein
VFAPAKGRNGVAPGGTGPSAHGAKALLQLLKRLVRFYENGGGRDRHIPPGDPVAIEIGDNFIRMNGQFSGRLHAAGLEENVGEQVANPGVPRAWKRADEAELPPSAQQAGDFGGIVGLNCQVEKRFWPLAQQAGKVPEVARPENDPEGRTQSAAGKSQNREARAALGCGYLLACHLLPHSILKSVKLYWQTTYESGIGAKSPPP